jgi:hypothetical protein
MAISYPLSIPTHTGISSFELRAINATAYSASPFTFAGTSYEYAGKAWQLDIDLPAMKRENAEIWISWLLSMKGRKGTFYAGDFQAVTPRGSARNSDNAALNSAVSSGSALSFDGAPVSTNNYLKSGDYIQVGTGASRQLFKCLEDVNTNSSGEASVEVWPNVRTSISNNASLTFESAQGVFRLASNEVSFSVNELAAYGLSFGAMEAI